MKIDNQTRWQTMPMKKILTRLSNKPGRVGSSRWLQGLVELRIAELKAKVPTYSCRSGQSGGRTTIWVPTKGISQFWFARIADEMLKQRDARYEHNPANVRLDMSVRREYEWAEPMAIEHKPPPKKLTVEQKAALKLKSIEKRTEEWQDRRKDAVSAQRRADTALKNLAKEKKTLLARIQRMTANVEPGDSE